MSTLFGGAGAGAGAANAIAGGGFGVAAQNAYGSPFAQFHQLQDIFAFQVEKIENGLIVHFGTKKFMCSDLDDAMDRVKACIVTNRLEK